MWILRRRLEIYFLVFALIPLWAGLHLPPPVAETRKLFGPVRQLERSGDGLYLDFSVQGKRLSSAYLEPDHSKLDSVIREGVAAEVLTWSWLGEDPAVLEVSIDGRRVVRRGPRYLLYWSASVAFLAIGSLIILLAVRGFRRQDTMWERYVRARRIVVERDRKRD